MDRVSIIIPTLNESKSIERTLRHLSILEPFPDEIIVVDGGSQDDTVERVKEYSKKFPKLNNIKVISSSCGRSQQMNQGAAIATGDILCFLHADTIIPDDTITVIRKTLSNPKISCGGFISIMRGTAITRWGISFHNYLKTYYAPLLFRPHLFIKGLRLLFGDQVMFCRRSDFEKCGGFDPKLPIMEEADLCLKLVQRGRICLVNRIVQSCDRRVAHWGSFKATLIYMYIGFLWGIGVSPDYLKRFYEDIR